MSNVCMNKLEAEPHVLKALLNEEGNIDFNLIVPQPPNIETGACNGQHAEGVVCWYDWNIANWGVKWNLDEGDESYDWNPDDGFLMFETPWNDPRQVIVELARKFKDEEIFFTASDPAMEWASIYILRNGSFYIDSTVGEDKCPDLYRIIVKDLWGSDYFDYGEKTD